MVHIRVWRSVRLGLGLRFSPGSLAVRACGSGLGFGRYPPLAAEK